MIVEDSPKRAHFSDKSYETIDISKANFKDISAQKSCKLAFIDGGNIEIAGNNNFSLQLMRTYHAVYSGNERIKSKRKDYIVFISTKKDSGDVYYIVEIYENENLIDTIKLNAYNNHEHQKPENAISTVRRIYEIREIAKILPLLEKEDIIIMDGSLSARNELETKEMENMQKLCLEKGISLTSISKTSSIMTDTGSNFVGYINNLGEEGKKWYYCNICRNNNVLHNAEIIIAKLHPLAEYAFVVDVMKQSYGKVGEILHNLSMNAKDPVFLGYPYGLLEADIQARCTEEEKEFLYTKFLHADPKNAAKMRKILNTNKAHEVLDSIADRKRYER
jgi:hypothetical protein